MLQTEMEIMSHKLCRILPVPFLLWVLVTSVMLRPERVGPGLGVWMVTQRKTVKSVGVIQDVERNKARP